jgi:hypothetical protein
VPFMHIEILCFSIPPTQEDFIYWDELTTIISTNSLVGLNDIVPGLRSQRLKIPAEMDKITYNKFDNRVHVVISNLTIETNARYWETSLIDSVTNYAVKKYGNLVDPKSEFITVLERNLYVSSHNTWKPQKNNIVMLRDKGDAKSLVAVGKVKLNNVFVNDYTVLHFLVKYKFAIKLESGETEEFIMNLAESIVMPDFLDGKYFD